MAEPSIAAYIQDGVAPQASYDERPGVWVEGSQWPLQNQPMNLHWSAAGRLVETMGEAGGQVSINSPLTTGAASGEYCVIWCGSDFPTDQR